MGNSPEKTQPPENPSPTPASGGQSLSPSVRGIKGEGGLNGIMYLYENGE